MHVYVSLSCLSSFLVFFGKSDLHISCLQEAVEKITELLNSGKRQYLPHFWSDIAIFVWGIYTYSALNIFIINLVFYKSKFLAVNHLIFQWTESNRSRLSCGHKSPTSCCGSSDPLDPRQTSSRSYHSTATPNAVDKSVNRFELTSSTARGLTSDSTRTRGTGKSRGSARVSSRFLQISSPSQYQAKLTPAEVTLMLRANEYTNSDLPTGPVKSYDMNTLRSNNPIEDAHSEALLWNGGYLFGIYDGHGGAACGQVVAKRLLNYIAAGLLSHAEIEMHLKAMHSGIMIFFMHIKM